MTAHRRANPPVAALVGLFCLFSALEAGGYPAPPPSVSWTMGKNPTNIERWPTNGLVVVNAELNDDFETPHSRASALAVVTFVVTDEDGTVLQGDLVYDDLWERLEWWARAPFAPQSRYQVYVMLENSALFDIGYDSRMPDQELSMLITTGDRPEERLVQASVDVYSLQKVTGCCEPSPCGDYSLGARFLPGRLAPHNVHVYEVSAVDDTGWCAHLGSLALSCSLDAVEGEACFDVSYGTLFLDERATLRVCKDVEEADASGVMCSDGCQCTAVGGQAPSTPWLVCLFLAAALSLASSRRSTA